MPVAIHLADVRAYLTLVAHDSGQPQYGLWNEGDDRQDNYCNKNERRRFADNRHQRLLGHVCDDEQQQSKWGREQANHDVDDHHDPEMHEINAECLRRWNQNRNDDKENRGSLK